ncbi:MAG: PD-(D/E)XK nuclease family protein [Patescibacteria group bacterium]
MPADKYTAVWTSHTSIGDFLKCPRAYFLKNVYRDPKTNHKIKITGPALALGQAVHEVLESLSILPTEERLREPLAVTFDRVWEKVKGKKGGFVSDELENQYKTRGKEMLWRVTNNPGPLMRLAVKIQQELPYFWLSEEENIILCGRIDWLEYLPDTDSVHIIDFKTGRSEENPDSLQLPIYYLLVQNCQKRPVSKASYWYLASDDEPVAQVLPPLEEARERVFAIARQIKVARQLGRFSCPSDGCYACRPLEGILRGEAEFVGADEFNYDVYLVARDGERAEADSIIL